MPHFLIRGLQPEQVCAISRPMTAELAALCGCPPDYFTFDCLHTTAVFDGGMTAAAPFVEIAWFDRGKDIRDKFAAVVDRYIRDLGVPETEIAFRVYREDSYYIGGLPAGRDEVDPTQILRRENAALKETNERLREQLSRTVRKPSAAPSDSTMSSKLRDALRE